MYVCVYVLLELCAMCENSGEQPNSIQTQLNSTPLDSTELNWTASHRIVQMNRIALTKAFLLLVSFFPTRRSHVDINITNQKWVERVTHKYGVEIHKSNGWESEFAFCDFFLFLLNLSKRDSIGGVYPNGHCVCVGVSVCVQFQLLC